MFCIHDLAIATMQSRGYSISRTKKKLIIFMTWLGKAVLVRTRGLSEPPDWPKLPRCVRDSPHVAFDATCSTRSAKLASKLDRAPRHRTLAFLGEMVYALSMLSAGK